MLQCIYSVFGFWKTKEKCMKKENQKIKVGLSGTVSLSNTRGFSLIEMLVVVLIIGILASIAVPQYQKAVDKARFMEALRIANSIKTAEEAFFLAYRTYTTNLNDLDIRFQHSVKSGSPGFEYWVADQKCVAVLKNINAVNDEGNSIAENAGNFYVWCRLSKGVNDRIGVFMFMDQATLDGHTPIPPNQRRACVVLNAYGGSTSRAQKVCESMGEATQLPTGLTGYPF